MIMNRTSLVMLLIGANALFLVLLYFIPREPLFQILNAACIASSAGVIAAYYKYAWDAVKNPPTRISAGQMLILSLTLAAFACILVFGTAAIWRYLHEPKEFLDTPWVAYTRWVMAVGMTLALTTRWSNHGQMLRRAYTLAGLTVTAGVFLAVLLVLFGLA
jgi:hypothetical protein